MANLTKSSKSATKSLAEGYRNGGCYHAIIATLEKMGVNKTHQYSAFAARIKSDWDGFKDFSKVEPRNENAKDTAGRLLQNCRVLQRTKDYAKPLLAAGAVIDIAYEGSELTIRLNTKSKKPITPGRQPKPQTAPKAAKPSKVVKAKAAKKSVSKSTTPILEGREALAALRKGK